MGLCGCACLYVGIGPWTLNFTYRLCEFNQPKRGHTRVPDRPERRPRPHGGIFEYRIGLYGGLAHTGAYSSTGLACTEA